MEDLDPNKIILSKQELLELCKGGMSHTCFIKIKPKNMALTEKIKTDVITAMKNSEKFKVATLRLLSASIKNAEIVKKEALNDLEVIAVIRKEIKKFQDTLESVKGNDKYQGIAAESQQGILVLQTYLPAALSNDEVNTIVDDAIAEHGSNTKKDMGAIMKLVSCKVAGRAEPKVVSEIVRNKLV